MDDRGAPLDRTVDLGDVQQIHAVHAVKASDIVATAPEVISYRSADMTAMPGHQNAHTCMISQGATGQ
jgi:hypothetical protein